jgi:probable F420-dependent oxidoreductase
MSHDVSSVYEPVTALRALQVGVAIFPTIRGIGPAELARAAEDRGFESLFFPDHTHIPVASANTFLGEERPVPEYYREMLDPFVALTAAACVTTRLRLGTGICLVTGRDPIVTAKTVATLDQLSGGRVIFGVGAGWNVHELENHGTDPRRRFAVMRERVLAMKAIWTQEEASYHGDYIDFGPIWSWPKPLQKPHPPILIGGNGPRALERVLEYGDGWLPEFEPTLLERVAELQQRAREAGRAQIDVTIYSARLEAVDQYRDVGANRCVFWLPPNDRDSALRRLDEIASALALGRPPEQQA